jgi:hypothetical protein
MRTHLRLDEPFHIELPRTEGNLTDSIETFGVEGTMNRLGKMFRRSLG